MTKHFLVIAFLLYTCLLAGILDEKSYQLFVDYSNNHEYFYVGTGLLFSVSLVVLSIVFSMSGSFRMVYAISRLFLEISQFMISLISLLALGLFIHFGLNLWTDLSRLVSFIPFLLLFAAAYSIRIFDFNYPVRNTLVGHFSLAAFSIAFLILGGMFGF